MILFYDPDGKIVSLSTWTLANPATYQTDGNLMIAGVGIRPLPADTRALDFQPDSSPAMAALALEIAVDQEPFTIVDGVLHRDGAPVTLDFTPGNAAVARDNLADNPQIVAFFTMTDAQVVSYAVANFGFSTQEAGVFVLLRNTIRSLARAAAISHR